MRLPGRVHARDSGQVLSHGTIVGRGRDERIRARGRGGVAVPADGRRTLPRSRRASPRSRRRRRSSARTSATTTSSPRIHSSRPTGRRSRSESDRLRLVDIGRTEEGRTQWMAIVSRPRTLQRLDRYQRHLAPAGARRRPERRSGPRAGRRGQGGRLDRRRAARQRGARRAATDRDWSISWSAVPTMRRVASCTT